MVVDQGSVAVRTDVPPLAPPDVAAAGMASADVAGEDVAPADRGRDGDAPVRTQVEPAHPPGWYPDPWSWSSLRWWDGRAWTVHVTPYPGRGGPDAKDAEAGAAPVVADPSGDHGDTPVSTETAAPLTGDLVRGLTFPTVRRGYHRLEVDPFLVLLAAELEAGRSPVPLVSRASFACTLPGYDRQDVERLLARAERSGHGSADGSSGPRPAPGQRFPHQSRRGVRAGVTSGSNRRRVQARKAETEECDARWRLLDTGPGLAMDMERTEGGWMLVAPSGAVLATVDDTLWFDDRRALLQHRPNVWMHRLPTAVRVDQRDYTVVTVGGRGRPTDGRADRSIGHPTTQRVPDCGLRLPHLAVVDPSGRTVLQLVGHHFDRRATSIVRLPSGELIQFPVHGTSPRNAVMHATEGSGRVILRFRETRQGRQAIADPSVPVTSDIVLLVVLASTFLPGYFRTPWGVA
jgi:DivIVA domain-containing protein